MNKKMKEAYFIGFKKSFLLVLFALAFGLIISLITHGWLFIIATVKGSFYSSILYSWIGVVAICMLLFFFYESDIDIPRKRILFSLFVPFAMNVYFHGYLPVLTYRLEEVFHQTSYGIASAFFASVVIDKLTPIRYK